MNVDVVDGSISASPLKERVGAQGPKVCDIGVNTEAIPIVDKGT